MRRLTECTLVLGLLLMSASPVRGRIAVRGANGGGSANLPTGVAAAMNGSTGATVQVHGSDATACLNLTLGTVRRDTGTVFVATD